MGHSQGRRRKRVLGLRRVQGGPVGTGAGNCGGGAGDLAPRGGRERKRLIEDVLHQAGEAAAVSDDDKAQFPPQRMARHDAEVTTDVGDDGADRPAADLGGDLRRGGQAGEARVRLGRWRARRVAGVRAAWAGTERPGAPHPDGRRCG